MTYTLLSCIDSRIIEPTKFYGRFELGPFSPGQGLTVANALRRALLSQLPGTAITLVHIVGASHEYDTLTGVQECVLDILLNLKQIIVKSEFEIFSPQVGFLNVIGPGIVRARDFKLPFFVSAIDPDQYIATLTNQGQLKMKFLVNCGKNYLTHSPSGSNYLKWVNLLEKAQPDFQTNKHENETISNDNLYRKWKSERQKPHSQLTYQLPIKENLQLNKNSQQQFLTETLENTSALNQNLNHTQTYKTGYFPIDAIFAPITRVNYTIELKNNLKTVHEIICLEIWTNGTIDPRHAIHNSVKSLIKLFLPLQQMHTNSNNINFIVSNLKKNDEIQKSVIENNLINLNNSNFNLRNVTESNTTQKNFTNNLKRLKTFNVLNQTSNLQKNSENLVVQTQITSQTKEKFFELDLLNLKLKSRSYRALKAGKINTVGTLVSKTKSQLLALTNFGESSLVEVQNALKNYGLTLKSEKI
uniref:DNA-directed RNA polymerase subunit alpha n=1 Tax=Halochlorococcum sp. NIES-1838 TaxID=2249730 RepID=A0A2Z4MAA4_9CHLO|nr:RpoA [Halochlorococcum sp. NIES-1838]